MIRVVAPAALVVLLAPGVTADVTFNRDIAPIVFRSCAPCHRPGGAGPFELLRYGDARKRARQIGIATRARYMPPWLPDRGAAPFAGDRRLSAAEIERIQAWVAQGTPEGDPADLPPAPVWPDGWVLGEPDLVLELPGPFTLPAEGFDVYRNFVVPSTVPRTRWVRAVEFRPSNPRVVHHARILLDRSAGSRHADRQDPEPGFAGMLPASAETPDGILVGWTPGKLPATSPAGLAFGLDPGADLVVQLHLVPSGKPETVRASIGLHFAEAPPVRRAFTLLLGSRDLDIPAGATDYVVEDRYTLPVDVELLGVYPHAHYLGREITVIADSQSGARRELLHIPRWDFNWQDEYRFSAPLALEAGTAVAMRYRYDNSPANARNPHDPPRRVRYGPRTTDEMAELALEVVPRRPVDLGRLEEHHRRSSVEKSIAFRERAIAADPDDFASRAALGSSYLYLGRPDRAIEHLRAASRLRPADAQVRNNLGYALRTAGRLEEAIVEYREAVRLAPGLAEAHLNLASICADLGRFEEALAAAREALRRAGAGPTADEARRQIERFERLRGLTAAPPPR